MNFFFGNTFWGVLLLLWGASLILKDLKIVDLPLVKIFLAVIIIMFGIRLLIGGSNHHVRTGSKHSGITSYGSSDYTSVFSSQSIDLTGLKPDSKPLDITAVFGSIYVELPDDIEFVFEPTAVFGSTVIPPKPSTVYVKPLGIVKIEASAIFGKVEFEYKPAKRPPSQSSGAKPDQEVNPDSL